MTTHHSKRPGYHQTAAKGTRGDTAALVWLYLAMVIIGCAFYLSTVGR